MSVLRADQNQSNHFPDRYTLLRRYYRRLFRPIFRSKKYERLQGEARHRYHEQKKNATVTYNAISATTNTINAIKSTANSARQAKSGRKVRPKKYKARNNTTVT